MIKNGPWFCVDEKLPSLKNQDDGLLLYIECVNKNFYEIYRRNV